MLNVVHSNLPEAGHFQKLAKLAITALQTEIDLDLKPGLVCPNHPGSHKDMTYFHFQQSLASLALPFQNLARAGGQGVEFPRLQALGVQAELGMLQATGGRNTHRGAIFNLGLLVAAAGWQSCHGQDLTAKALTETVLQLWGPGLKSVGPNLGSHGELVKKNYGVSGARGEAAAGFPSVTQGALPVYKQTLAETQDTERASLQTLLSLIRTLDDTNLLWRGGPQGLRWSQEAAEDFLRQGGVFHPDWRIRLRHLQDQFAEKNLSPGGSADLLAVTHFLFSVEIL